MMSRTSLALIALCVCAVLTSCCAEKATHESELQHEAHSVQKAAIHMADRARHAASKATEESPDLTAAQQRAEVHAAADRVWQEVGASKSDVEQEAEAVKQAGGRTVASSVGHGLAKAASMLGHGAFMAVESVLRTVPEDENLHAFQAAKQSEGTNLAGMAVKFSKIMTRGSTMEPNEPADAGNVADNVEKKQDAAARGTEKNE